jgi:succinate dehydrogenase / fumarate reductase flavoprotein subunit/fumarate reductase flavoprotein subunit
VREICAHWIRPLERSTGENPFQLRAELEHIMWTKVGVVRNGPDMQSALPEIQHIRARIKQGIASPLTPDTRHPTPNLKHPTPNSPIYNALWNEAINTENLATIAEMLTRSALAREESRGAHYRSDFPKQNADWLKNIRMCPRGDSDFEVTFTPVEFTRLTPEELREHRQRAGLKTLPAIDDE